MTTPPTPPTDNLAAEGGPRSEMSEQDVTVETLVTAVLDEARGYRIDRAILTVALSRALPDAGLRERMEALADEFDAKGRRGSAHFGADVGDTIRLWIERDPRGECDHAPEHVTGDGTRWPLTCDACRSVTLPASTDPEATR